jgi:hypothetical protein
MEENRVSRVSVQDIVELDDDEREFLFAKREEAIKAFITGKTPRRAVKHRRARGIGTASYVQVSYVQEQLNALFNRRWNFEIVREEVYSDLKQISVLGRLTVFPGNCPPIIKEQYGSSEIKTDRETHNKIISLPDDKKAAASDALKKCASLLGVAADVYAGVEAEEAKGEAPAKKGAYALQSMLKAGEGLGKSLADIEAECKGRFNKSSGELSISEASELASKWAKERWLRKKEGG